MTPNNLTAFTGSVDGAQDTFALWSASRSILYGISRNQFLNITSQPVGQTDSQTISNKTYDNSNTFTVKDGNLTLQNSAGTTKQAKFSLASITAGQTRTFTLPDTSDTLVTLGATQTLTAKTLTSPTISGGTIDNSAITVDSIAGHTASTTGTIYGVAITAGVITSSNSVGSGALAAASVTPSKLATGAAQAVVTTSETTTSTSYVQLTTTTDQITVTVGSNGILLISLAAAISNSGGTAYVSFALSGSNTQAGADSLSINQTTTAQIGYGATFLVTGLSAGSTTIKMQYRVSAGTGTFLNRRIAAVPL